MTFSGGGSNSEQSEWEACVSASTYSNRPLLLGVIHDNMVVILASAHSFWALWNNFKELMWSSIWIGIVWSIKIPWRQHSCVSLHSGYIFHLVTKQKNTQHNSLWVINEWQLTIPSIVSSIIMIPRQWLIIVTNELLTKKESKAWAPSQNTTTSLKAL